MTDIINRRRVLILVEHGLAYLACALVLVALLGTAAVPVNFLLGMVNGSIGVIRWMDAR